MISGNFFSRMIKLSVATLSLFVLASCSSTQSRDVAGSFSEFRGEYKSVEQTHNKRFIKSDNY